MMDRKEKEKRQSASDEERMTGDEPAGSKSVDVFEVLDDSEDGKSAESENGEKCVRNLKTFEEEPSRDNSCVFAKPSKNNSESGIEENKSQKEMDVSEMRSLLCLAQESVRENMKKLSHCMNVIGKTLMKEKEVEKNNSMHPLSSSLKTQNSGTLKEVIDFEILWGSELCLGIAAVDRRLKVIKEKLLALKKDDVDGPPMKSSVFGLNVIDCDTDGIQKGVSENSIPTAELRYPDKSFTKSTEHLESNASGLKVSFTDVEKESLDQQACTSPRKGSDVSFNVKPENDIPVTNSEEHGSEDDPSSESLPNSKVNISSKRSFPFCNRTEIIPAMKRLKVESVDFPERKYLQTRELNFQNGILSPNRTLKVDLGFRCDSSEFQVDPRKWSKCLSKESIHPLKGIKTENESTSNENHRNVVSEQHKRVKREVEVSSPVKHGLMGTFEDCSQRNGECQEDDHVPHPSKRDLLAFIGRKYSLRAFKNTNLSKESKSNRLETAEQKTEIKTEVEPAELEEEFQMSAMQMDCHSVKMEVEECNSTISGVDEVEVLKVIKPVCVLLGYRCDSKEILKKDNNS